MIVYFGYFRPELWEICKSEEWEIREGEFLIARGSRKEIFEFYHNYRDS